MKTSFAVVIGLFISASLNASAPVVNNHSVLQTKRVPAQSQVVGVKPIEHYMDFSCEDFIASSDKDKFSRHMINEFKKLDSDFCSLVGSLDGEDSFSQSEQRKVGLGTFSKLVEGHYHEYAQGVELEHFQDMSCEEYMQSSDDKSFKAFFKAQLMDLGSDVCSKIGDYSKEDGVERIGLGTYSKLVESAFWDYNSRAFELR